ncbi:hypothetical protein PR001_g22186 [Phytophthora rubi]|uniref:Uncharacterized protein n=1 Tax=Phytophthora rubi TaxID=129364 RepID=A0A6A3J6N7_9STRA|nr:hypothetical protein PR001_g22186 [Phytophthora rubi]
MVGWEIELESADTKHLERGVIKQVDCDINCALVLFAEGRKEWLDLTFFRVKISGHQPSPRDSNADGVARESTKPHNTGDDTSGISDSITPSSPHNFHVAVSSLSMPRIDPDAFDWHLEGTHVELCNRDGHFLEGAALCSKPKSHLQLYNENRGFFEVACSVQGFKVVIHGLENLKKIPMGQIVEVYSPLIGRFRSGTVLKAAVLGHLTPIRFGPSTAVEWLDLKSQTFKLVFLPHITDAFEHLDDMDHALQHADLSPHKSHEQDSHRSPDLEYPHLYEGQGIEIFDDHSKQYLKFKVAAQSNWSSEAYIFEQVENPAGGTSSRSAKHVVSSLSHLRSRLLLQPAHWEKYHRILVGHRVDVYDRVGIGKSVMNGKIHAVGGSENSSDEPTILVRFKDGHQSWINLRTNKVKLRMHPAIEATRASEDGPKTPPQTSPRTEGSDEIYVSPKHTSNLIPAVHPIKNDSTPPKPDQAQSLFRIPSGEISHDLEYTLPKTSPIPNPVSEPEVPATGGGPGRKPPPGKRAALHRRASQSADVPKTSLPAEPTEPPAQPSPIKEESPLAQAVPPIKPLSPLQSPRIDSHQMRPVSPGGPLPPVQPGSNSNSPSKTQLPTQVGAHEHPGS